MTLSDGVLDIRWEDARRERRFLDQDPGVYRSPSMWRWQDFPMNVVVVLPIQHGDGILFGMCSTERCDFKHWEADGTPIRYPEF